MLTNLDKTNSLQLGQNLCLKPLKAQVGGHVYMKLLNDSQVCKPLNQREEKFYQNIPKNLLDHVPQFLGTVEIENNVGESSREGGVSPSQYLVLENLTKGFNKPCILDLKMGTRMYGDFATEAKRKSQRKKSKRSTSLKLGIRFCGSQRFSSSQRSFETIDKYVGRNADETELKTLLQKFFTCRGGLRSEVICDVMKNVSQIRQTLIDLPEYRFYSSSLLIIYEGQPDPVSSYAEDKTDNSMDCEEFDQAISADNNKRRKQDNSRVTMKIIDFANVSFPSDGDQQQQQQQASSSHHHDGPDDGFIMGLDNLYTILQTILEEDQFYL